MAQTTATRSVVVRVVCHTPFSSSPLSAINMFAAVVCRDLLAPHLESNTSLFFHNVKKKKSTYLYTNFHFEKTYLQQVFSPSGTEIMLSDPVRLCVCGGGQGHALVQDKEAVICLTSLKICSVKCLKSSLATYSPNNY